MRSLRLLALFAFATLFVVSATENRAFAHSALTRTGALQNENHGTNLTGKWKLSVVTDGGNDTATLNLSVADDGAISGTVHSDTYGDATITSGSQNNNKFSFRFSINIQDVSTPVTMEGSIDGDSLQGSGVAGDSTFTYTGSRAS
jgi:hypothetical protein